MIGSDFKKIMDSNEIFVGDKNSSIVLLDINGHPYNIPKEYRRINCKWHESLRVNLFHTKNDRDLYIDFIFCGSNLYASHKLSELSIPQLVKEFDKFLLSSNDYKKWRRDILINHIIT